MSQGIWVLAEHNRGELAEVTIEILDEARKLAGRTAEVAALLIGGDGAELVQPLAHYGADKVYLVEHPALQSYTTDGFVSVLESLVRQHQPSVLIGGATPMGNDLFPRLAARLKTGLVTNCTLIKRGRESGLEITKPVYGGKFYATMTCPSAQPLMATIVPGVIGLGKPDPTRKAEVVKVSPELDAEAIRTRPLGVIKADPRTVDIVEAEVVVAGGRGLGSGEAFCLIQDLADVLSGSMAGSRPAVDNRWVPFERQIGQTGKTVAPKLIISCGVSGATQHIMGMKDSKLIVAINVDKAAPIFKNADVAIVADVHQFLPVLIEAVRQAKDSVAKRAAPETAAKAHN